MEDEEEEEEDGLFLVFMPMWIFFRFLYDG
jgi:hypothetical protein